MGHLHQRDQECLINIQIPGPPSWIYWIRMSGKQGPERDILKITSWVLGTPKFWEFLIATHRMGTMESQTIFSGANELQFHSIWYDYKVVQLWILGSSEQSLAFVFQAYSMPFASWNLLCTGPGHQVLITPTVCFPPSPKPFSHLTSSFSLPWLHSNLASSGKPSLPPIQSQSHRLF